MTVSATPGEEDPVNANPAEPDRHLIVVVFGSGPADGWCDLSHCPMHAYGPFTRREADQAAAQMPGWMQAHILDLRQPAEVTG